jgi:regulatory protein
MTAAPPSSDGDRRPAPGPGPVGGDDPPADRTSRLAELAAAIARIGPDGTDGSTAAGRPVGGGSGQVRGSGPRQPGQVDGSSGRGRRHRSGRPSGSGHPSRPAGDADPERRVVVGPPPDDPAAPANDPPGDPEAVAKAICLRLLTGAARSRADLAQALRRREIPQEVADRVLDRFAEVGLIDDAAYADAFVASKHRDRGLGRAALRTELRRKGIDPGVADRAVDALDGESERRRAEDLVAKRLDSAVFAGLPAARRRLLGLLARRGYPASLAASVVDVALRGFADPTALEPGDDTVAAGWDDAGL